MKQSERRRESGVCHSTEMRRLKRFVGKVRSLVLDKLNLELYLASK